MKITSKELHELLELSRSENKLQINHINGLVEKQHRVYAQQKQQLFNDVQGMMGDAESKEIRDTLERVLTLIKHTL